MTARAEYADADDRAYHAPLCRARRAACERRPCMRCGQDNGCNLTPCCPCMVADPIAHPIMKPAR